MQPTLGVFDIFGPVMVGPSSSHTAGVSRLGSMTRQILGKEPTRIHLDLFGSVGINYLECNSHNAIISGMLGWKPDDLRLSKAIAEACQRGIKVDWQVRDTPVEHPNTVRIITGAADGTVVEMAGISTGGGKIRVVEINGHRVGLDGKEQGLLVITDSSSKQAALDFLKKKGMPLSGIQESVKSGEYLVVVNAREPLGESTLEKLRGLAGVTLVSELKALDHNVMNDVGPVESIQKMAQAAEAGGISLAEVFLEREQERLGLTRVELLAEMLKLVKVMRNAVETGLAGGLPSFPGLPGDNAPRMGKSLREKGDYFGDTLAKAIVNSLAVVEVCASRSLPVVAAPTGGASGTVLGVVVTVAEVLKKNDEDIALALFAAGGVGIVMAQRVGLSGSVAGCQAECGAASAMAAAAAAQLAGATPTQVLDAAGITLKNHLGQVCDPAVELGVPCIKRNGISAAMALASSEMALAGVRSAIPFDEVADAMAEIGGCLPPAFKAMRTVGLVATPTGMALRERFETYLSRQAK